MAEAKVKVTTKRKTAKKKQPEVFNRNMSDEELVKMFRARYEMFEHPAKVRRAAECLAEVLGQ